MSASDDLTNPDNYKECLKCGADFDQLTLGGVGTWRNTIMCDMCGHVQKSVNFEGVIAPLLADRYGGTTSKHVALQKAIDSEFDEQVKRSRVKQ